MPILTCPHCGLEKPIDPKRLSPAQIRLCCPRCKRVFTVDGAALLAPPPPPETLELDWGDRRPPTAEPPLSDDPPAAPPPPTPAQAPPDPFAIPSAPVYQPAFTSPASADLPGPPPPFWKWLLHPGAPSAETGHSYRFTFDDPVVNGLALPAAIAAAFLAKLLILPGFLLDWFRAWLHEFGHAFAAWLASHAATPLALVPGLAWASTSRDKSTFVYLCFLFLLGVIGFRALRARSWLLLGFAGTLFVMQTILTFGVSERTAERVMVFCGAGGELILSTLLVIGFHHRLPDRVRWDFFRFLALPSAVYVFGAAGIMWVRAQSDPRAIPWGTGWGGRDDPGGDMQRLMAFGWSEGELTHAYLSLLVICSAVIVGQYLWFLWKAKAALARRLRT